MLSVLPIMRMVLGEGSEMFCTSLWYHSIVTGSGGPTASQVRSKGVFRVTFTSLGCFVNVGKPEGGGKKNLSETSKATHTVLTKDSCPKISFWSFYIKKNSSASKAVSETNFFKGRQPSELNFIHSWNRKPVHWWERVKRQNEIRKNKRIAHTYLQPLL